MSPGLDRPKGNEFVAESQVVSLRNVAVQYLHGAREERVCLERLEKRPLFKERALL